MIRLLALVLFGLPLAVATVIEAGRGDTFSMALALGTLGPLVFVATATALMRAMTPSPRKADPAKIARMERELGFEPPLKGPREWVFTETGDIRPADEAPTEPDIMDAPEAVHAVETGCTTMLVVPDVEDCPRPESCVMAHPCRKCGAGRGEVCVGDLHLDTRALAQPE